MASIKTIIEKEKQRSTLSEGRVIHLYQEGSFLRAYDWSAWLWTCRISPFKVSHRLFKGVDGSVALIGFPPTSLEKLTDEDCLVERHDDKTIDISLSEQIIPSDYDISLLQADYEEWKRSLPTPSDAKADRNSENNRADEHRRLLMPQRQSDIIQRILAFNVNKSTPFQCMEFISEIQSQLIANL